MPLNSVNVRLCINTIFLLDAGQISFKARFCVFLCAQWESSENTLILFGQAFVWDPSKPKQPEEGPQQSASNSLTIQTHSA